MSAGTGAAALHGMWSYHSSLVAYQQANSNVWFVAWQPSVMGPNLTAKTHLAAVQVAPKVSMVADAGGGNLTAYSDPGLTNIAGLLMKAAPPGQGKPGLDVEIQTAAGAPVKNSQAVILDPENVQSVATTISSTAEAAAQAAVGMHKQSSMVVIQPSTGKILAIANNDGFNDFALTADVSPGLHDEGHHVHGAAQRGGAHPDEPGRLPEDVHRAGHHLPQRQGRDRAGRDAVHDRLRAVLQQRVHLPVRAPVRGAGEHGEGVLRPRPEVGHRHLRDLRVLLQRAGRRVRAPSSPRRRSAREQLQASPLAMASVAATVDTGTFEQPILVPGTKQVTATPLPAATDADLKEMMRAVVTSGTAAGLGFGPTVYAKTGTADIQNQGKPNSWLIAFDSGPGRRGRLPGPRRGLRRPVRGPRGAELPQPLLTATTKPRLRVQAARPAAGRA